MQQEWHYKKLSVFLFLNALAGFTYVCGVEIKELFLKPYTQIINSYTEMIHYQKNMSYKHGTTSITVFNTDIYFWPSSIDLGFEVSVTEKEYDQLVDVDGKIELKSEKKLMVLALKNNSERLHFCVDAVDKGLLQDSINNGASEYLKFNHQPINDSFVQGRMYAIAYAQQLMAEVIKSYLNDESPAINALLEEHKKIFNVSAEESGAIHVIGKFLKKEKPLKAVAKAYKTGTHFQKMYYHSPLQKVSRWFARRGLMSHVFP